MGIDNTDKRILLALDENSRSSYSSLAKKLRMPAQTARYRIQRLIQDGVVQQLLTVFDLGRVGFYYYKIFFKFHNIDAKKLVEIVNDLTNRKGVNWVIEVDGKYDIGFTVHVRNPMELSELMDSLRNKYRHYIHTQAFSVNIRMQFLTRDYLSPRKTIEKVKGEYKAASEPNKIDPLDEKIISQLSQNSRKSNAAIASTLEVLPETVSNRIATLERKKIIVRYSVVLDPQKIGILNYYVLIYLNNITPKREKEFVEFCKNKPALVYLVKALGEWDYELNLEVESVQKYREIMMELSDEFSDVVREYSGMFVNNIRKFVYP